MSETESQEVVEPDGTVTYRARRHRRTTITLVVLLAALAGAFYYASTYWNSTGTTAPTACSTTVPVAPLKAADVRVNVYNATKRTGLAGQVAKDLAARKFKITAVANDPVGKPVAAVAQVRFGPEGAASAKLVATHVPGAELVEDKQRKGDTVDLALGNAWKQLGPVPVVTPTPSLPLCPGVTAPTP